MLASPGVQLVGSARPQTRVLGHARLVPPRSGPVEAVAPPRALPLCALAAFTSGVLLGASGHRPGRRKRPPAAVARPASRAQRSLAFLDKLGEAEDRLLRQLRERLPAMVASLRADAGADAGPMVMWGVDLEAPSEALDVVLLKFLRAADMSPSAAEARLRDTLTFRAKEGVGTYGPEDLPEQYQGHDFISGPDREGRPVLVSHYGQLGDAAFGDVEAFVKYRTCIMEQLMSRLQFERGQPETVTQVHDYTGVPLIFKSSQVKAGVNAITKVFAAHYPETKGTTIFVNFPAIFSRLFQAFSRFIPERTRNKFVILGEGDHELLFRQIPPEQVPESIGGMLPRLPGKVTGPCTVTVVRAGSTEQVLLKDVAGPSTTAWELRVCARDIGYELVFVPRGGGTERAVAGTQLRAEDGILRGEFRAEAPGRLMCRFTSPASWFPQDRVCVSRAQVLPS